MFPGIPYKYFSYILLHINVIQAHFIYHLAMEGEGHRFGIEFTAKFTREFQIGA
jgi:hypothetical protein